MQNDPDSVEIFGLTFSRPTEPTGWERFVARIRKLLRK